MSSTKTELPKMKLSLKREALRTLTDNEVEVLDAVVGGTCDTTQCCNSTQCIGSLVNAGC